MEVKDDNEKDFIAKFRMFLEKDKKKTLEMIHSLLKDQYFFDGFISKHSLRTNAKGEKISSYMLRIPIKDVQRGFLKENVKYRVYAVPLEED